MSGGSLDYFFSSLEEHIGDFGDAELDDLVKDLGTLFHDREWFLSGDTCEGSWNESRDNFKRKWFGEHAREDRIKKYLDDIYETVMKQFGLSEKYCNNCRYWSEENDGSPYGKCYFGKKCLMHRYESCEKFRK